MDLPGLWGKQVDLDERVDVGPLEEAGTKAHRGGTAGQAVGAGGDPRDEASKALLELAETLVSQEPPAAQEIVVRRAQRVSKARREWEDPPSPHTRC